MAQSASNISFGAYNLSQMLLERAKQAGIALQQILAIIQQKKMSPVYPLQVFIAGKIEEALRELQTGKTMGKIVVEFQHEEQVEVRV